MGQADAIWQSVLWFFLEEFALYGASLHCLATTAVHIGPGRHLGLRSAVGRSADKLSRVRVVLKMIPNLTSSGARLFET
jgi:hypothetical protein